MQWRLVAVQTWGLMLDGEIGRWLATLSLCSTYTLSEHSKMFAEVVYRVYNGEEETFEEALLQVKLAGKLLLCIK